MPYPFTRGHKWEIPNEAERGKDWLGPDALTNSLEYDEGRQDLIDRLYPSIV